MSELKLQHLDKIYDNKVQAVFDFNLDVKDGELIVLVGPSGCGKSTITSLIMKRHKPESGTITLGGVPLERISRAELMRRVTRISHDSYIFKGTVRENLLMGNEKADDRTLLNVLDKVDMLEFIKANGGLDMAVLEKGANFSGGQKQRIALARALLNDSEIYIFDEATSNVDVESENRIMEIVKELSKNKSVVLISHRLANVTGADMILYLENGRIAESGTHEELCSRNGKYAAIYNRQQELESFRGGF